MTKQDPFTSAWPKGCRARASDNSQGSRTRIRAKGSESWTIASGFAALLGLLCAAEPASQTPAAQARAAFFQMTNIHTVHLTFEAEQWEAMEPEGGGGFGGPGGPPGFGDRRGRGGGGRFGGPGSPTGPDRPGAQNGQASAGGPGPDFSLGSRLGPAFMAAGDADSNGQLTQSEFQALGEKWFTSWDTNRANKLNVDQLKEGLNAALMPPNPGAAGPPGGGGQMPGMGLQGPEGKRNGLASMLGIEFPYVKADLELSGYTFRDVGVRYKGNGTFLESRGSLKRSLKIDFNQYARNQRFAGMSQLNLHNNVTDPSWMNEVMSHRLFRDAGVPAPRTAYARVFATVPGKFQRHYLGLYSVVEDVGEAFVEDRFATKEGALYKPVTPALFADLGDDWKNYKQTYDPKTDLSAAHKARLMEVCRWMTQADDHTFASRLGEFFELDELARYMAALVWMVDLDGILGPGQNLYLYLHPATRKLHLMPWDHDHSFGQFPMRGTQEEREQLSIQRPWQGDNRFLERLFKVEDFLKRYREHLTEFNRTLCTPERLAAQVDSIAAAIRPAVAEESEEKLERFDRAVAGNVSHPEPMGFGGPLRFGPPTKPIKPFAEIRARSVTDQLAGQSKGRVLGEFGFPGGPGRRGPGGQGGPSGPGRFGPGNFLTDGWLLAMDADRDRAVTRDEFTRGFSTWFRKWSAESGDPLTLNQLRAGIDETFAPPWARPGGAPGFGAPTTPPREP